MSGQPNFTNRTLFHGDNLPVLRGMNSECVDLIATDPPFNKGKDFHATPDSLAKGAKFQDRWSWERDVHDEWVDQITDDHPRLMEAIESARHAHSDGMGAFVCFMAVRLLAMHRLLKPTGSLWLHCDPTASHYLKAVLDAIFGHKQFRNEVVWHYSGWNKRLAQHIERRHDVLLFYAKSPAQTFDYPTRPWRSKEEYIARRKQKVHTDDAGREYVLSDAGGGNRVRRYIDEAMTYGVPLDDVWSIDKINNSDKSENTGYPTQKPLALYERIIAASTPPRRWCSIPLLAVRQRASLRNGWADSGSGSTYGSESTKLSSTGSNGKDSPHPTATPADGCSPSETSPTPLRRRSAPMTATQPRRSCGSASATPSRTVRRCRAPRWSSTY